MVECPVCDGKIDVDEEEVDEGETISCDECGAALKVVGTDPLELESVIRQSEEKGQTLKAFYHSHPDHDAYFSDEDKAFASPFGEPTYPDAAQIVVSVYNRAVKIIRAFAWSDEKDDFVEVPIDRL